MHDDRSVPFRSLKMRQREDDAEPLSAFDRHLRPSMRRLLAAARRVFRGKLAGVLQP